VTGRFLTQTWQRPVTTCVHKPEAINTVYSSWCWAVCRSKHVEPSVNFGIINSVTSCILLVFLLSHTAMHESMDINTLRTGDAELRFCVTTVQDGWRRFAFLTGWNSLHLQVLLSATPQGGMFPEVSHAEALLGSLLSISWKFQFTKIISEFVINF